MAIALELKHVRCKMTKTIQGDIKDLRGRGEGNLVIPDEPTQMQCIFCFFPI